MDSDELILIGAGGHASVVLDALLLRDPMAAVSLVDQDAAHNGRSVLGLIVAAPFDFDTTTGRLFHVAIGLNEARAAIFSAMVSADNFPKSICHPTAVLARSAILDEGCFVAAGAIVSSRVVIQKGTIVNHGTIVDHDCKIGAFCHIAPNVTLGGNVAVGDGVLLGSSAAVLPGIQIGSGAIIGTGSVVTRDVGENQTVVGNPARIFQKV